MSDRLFLALAAVVAVAMIGLAAVWPQGIGARSPGSFGHDPELQSPAMQAAMAREAAAHRHGAPPPTDNAPAPGDEGLRSGQ